MDRLFDREADYANADSLLNAEELRGKTLVEVCTVRQKNLKDLALGNLFWLLQLRHARNAGAQVMVNDFYDKVGSSNQGIKDLIALLGLDQMEDSQSPVILREAEKVPRNAEAWQRFCDYVRENKEEQAVWETIGTVREGIQTVLETEGYDVPSTMDRFLEELSTWVHYIDLDAVQLLHHERETTAWVRRLYPEARKEFWHLNLPWENEYRGRYKEVDGERRISGRRIRDLADKLAMTEADCVGDENLPLYRHLFKELTTALEDATPIEELNYPLTTVIEQEEADEWGLDLMEAQRDFLRRVGREHPISQQILKNCKVERVKGAGERLAQVDMQLLPFYLVDQDALPCSLKVQKGSKEFYSGILLLLRRQAREGTLDLAKVVAMSKAVYPDAYDFFLRDSEFLQFLGELNPSEGLNYWEALVKNFVFLETAPEFYFPPALSVQFLEGLSPEEERRLAEIYLNVWKKRRVPSRKGDWKSPLVQKLSNDPYVQSEMTASAPAIARRIDRLDHAMPGRETMRQFLEQFKPGVFDEIDSYPDSTGDVGYYVMEEDDLY